LEPWGVNVYFVSRGKVLDDQNGCHMIQMIDQSRYYEIQFSWVQFTMLELLLSKIMRMMIDQSRYYEIQFSWFQFTMLELLLSEIMRIYRSSVIPNR